MPPLYLIIIGGALSAIFLIIGIVVSITSEKSLVEERLGRYVDQDQAQVVRGPRSSPLTDWMNRRVE